MTTVCGRVHFGPLLAGADGVVCFACKAAMTPADVATYWRLRLQVKTIIRNAQLSVVDYLKKKGAL